MANPALTEKVSLTQKLFVSSRPPFNADFFFNAVLQCSVFWHEFTVVEEQIRTSFYLTANLICLSTTDCRTMALFG